MQAENNKKDIKTLSFGCRLNALECEQIKNMLESHGVGGVLVNTCSVTAEAERQCGQAVRKIARENPGTDIFVTGCGATRNSELFDKIAGVHVIPNADKMNPNAYLAVANCTAARKIRLRNADSDMEMSKKFIQIQNGCVHDCTYCITRLLRGPAVSFECAEILDSVHDAVAAGFGEVVLTGVDIASYVKNCHGRPFLLADLCNKILREVPELRRLRLSSVDPAAPTISNIIEIMKQDSRMMPHLHLSMQSGSDTILRAMRRRHTADTVRNLVRQSADQISFSWDIICGFPGETDELFAETLNLVRELKPIRIHAFPYSRRPGTVAAEMPNQIPHDVARNRVKVITNAANENLRRFMTGLVGKTTTVLVESKNLARTPDDIPVKIIGPEIPARTICDVKITEIDGDFALGKQVHDITRIHPKE